MRRYAIAASLIALAALTTGCGLVLFSAVEPDARLRPQPGTYQEAIYVEPERRDGQDFYWSETPGATMNEFVWFDGLSVTGDTTFRYFTISDSGVRSPIFEAVYLIEDGSAPSVSAPLVSQAFPSYRTYGITWNATGPNSGGTQNPTDDLTPSGLLEYAVFSSASNNISTIGEAITNGRVELTWRNWWELEGLSNDGGSGVFVDPDGGRLGLRYTAGRPGETRFFNVFVRDRNGNTTGYGTRSFASRSAQSIYVVDGSTANDVIQLNNAIDVDFPGGEPSFTSYADSPLADGGAVFAFNETLSVALGRIDGDSLDDLAIVSRDTTNGVFAFRWYRALGNGRFNGDAPAVELMTEPLDAVPKTVALADFNGDGNLEIIVNTHDGPGNFGLRVYNRDGELIVATSAQARDFAVGDITGNGLADIVAWDTAAPEAIEVWVNNDGVSLSRVIQSSLVPPTGFTNVALADIDNDGKDDLLVVSATAPVVEIFHGTATGDLSESFGETWIRSDLITTITDATHVTPIDFNLDGAVDLFIGTSDVSSLQTNNGDGTFTGFVETTNAGAIDSVVFDANGDGWPDIVEVYATMAPQLWLNQEGSGLSQSWASIGSADTTTVAAGRLR